VWHGITRWCVPIFVMVSGALHLSSLSKSGTKSSGGGLPVTAIRRAVVAFVFWSAAYVAFTRFTLGWDLSKRDMLIGFIEGKIHLWFLPMICGLYLITPLLRPLAADEGLLRLFLALSCVFSFVLPSLRATWDCLTPRITDDLLLRVVGAFFRFLENTRFHFTLEYSSYYLLGYALHTHPMNKRQSVVSALLALVLFFLAVATSASASRITGVPTDTTYAYMTLPTLFGSVALFGAAQWLCGYGAVSCDMKTDAITMQGSFKQSTATKQTLHISLQSACSWLI
ncbi:MAG: acyltransferase family protein, partial [Clostridia bacterium]|nr:acyltransferase family protein [Clostridia bacterium]